MRRAEMHAEEEGIRLPREIPDQLFGPIRQQLGKIAGMVDLDVPVPEVFFLRPSDVGVVVDGAAAESVEGFVAALQGSEPGQSTEMPLAHERRAVTRRAQQRGQRGMVRWQARTRIDERLVQTHLEAILVSARHQRGPRR
jgi:hypothetical protein